MDVSQQATLLGRPERGAAAELANTTEVVKQCRGEQEVGAQARMELRGLATQRRHADRVLEEATRVAVVPVGAGCRERPQGRANIRVTEERAHDGGKNGMRDLGGEELEEAVELVDVAPKRGRQSRRVGVMDGLQRSDLDLQLSVEPFHAP